VSHTDTDIYSIATPGVNILSFVSTANVVTAVIDNASGGSITINGTLNVTVVKAQTFAMDQATLITAPAGVKAPLIVSNGFFVETGGSPDLNQSGVTYRYIAFF
jgi:hypothetical protein